MDQTRIATLVEFALATAAREDLGDRELGEIHLLKMIYLADLAYARAHNGQTLTGVPWIFHNFGPWDIALHGLLAALLATSTYRVERKTSAMGEYNRFAIAEEDADAIEDRFRDLEGKLPPEAASAVKWAVRQFGADTQDLLHHVYRTEPMLHAAPEERLDFSQLRPLPSGPARGVMSVHGEAPSKTQLRKAEEAKQLARGRIKALLQKKREARRGNALQVEADPDYLEIMSLLGQDDMLQPPEAGGLMVIDPDYWNTGTRRLFDISE